MSCIVSAFTQNVIFFFVMGTLLLSSAQENVPESLKEAIDVRNSRPADLIQKSAAYGSSRGGGYGGYRGGGGGYSRGYSSSYGSRSYGSSYYSGGSSYGYYYPVSYGSYYSQPLYSGFFAGCCCNSGSSSTGTASTGTTSNARLQSQSGQRPRDARRPIFTK